MKLGSVGEKVFAIICKALDRQVLCTKVTVGTGHLVATQPLHARTLALLVLFIGGCGKPYSPPIPIEPSLPATRSDDVIQKPIVYPSRWLGSETLTVAPGVHVLGELHPSAAFAIETNQGIVLIDTGVDESGVVVREGLTAVGLRVDRVRYILLTHAHYDHVFGTNKLREMSGAIVCAGRDDCEVLRTADLDSIYSLFPHHPYSGAPIEVDRELGDGEVIELDDVKIRIIGAPGHTPGSVCYLLEKDSQRILFSGDVIASLNFGPATYPAHFSPRYRGDAESFLHTINHLIEMEPPDLLLPGHPRQQTRMQTIRMDEQHWNALLEPARKELQDVVRRHRQDGADFLDGVAKEIEAGLYYLGDLDGVATYCLMDGQQLVVINAPGGDQFASFLREQFESLALPVKSPTLVLLTSDDETSRSGLESLTTKPRVVVPQSVLKSVQAAGFDVVSHHELAASSTLPIESIPLHDALGYSLSWSGKQVLITPNVPRNFTLEWRDRLSGRKTFGGLQPQVHDLSKELAASPEISRSYRESLQQLEKFSPDIWLPSKPLTGQNANLYDDDWSSIIANNLRQTGATEPN